MFMVIMIVCTLHSCFDFSMFVHMPVTVEQCVLSMTIAAITLHIQRPDWHIQKVSCIPVVET